MNAAIPALLAALLAAPAHATIYKCLLDDGRVFYQDAPCGAGRELRDFDKDPANVSVVPFTQPAAPAKSPAARDRTAKPAPAPREVKPKKAAEAAGDPRQRKFLRPGTSE